jgi:hypothetical protein
MRIYHDIHVYIYIYTYIHIYIYTSLTAVEESVICEELLTIYIYMYNTKGIDINIL